MPENCEPYSSWLWAKGRFECMICGSIRKCNSSGRMFIIVDRAGWYANRNMVLLITERNGG